MFQSFTNQTKQLKLHSNNFLILHIACIKKRVTCNKENSECGERFVDQPLEVMVEFWVCKYVTNHKI